MIKNFDEVFEDVTKRGTKIKTDEYRLSGKHQIIDQGQEQVAGYTDLEDGVFENIPAIIFGDHTRIVKYIDKPFFLGADGVKVLRSRFQDANYRYLYYALKYVKIPNTGYNRHFKWLKESKIQYPCAEKQEEIVSVLNGVSKIIEYRQQQLQKLDELVKARFVEMFGDLVVGNKIKTNRHKIGDIAFVTKLAGFEFTKYVQYKECGDIIMLRGLNCKKGKLVLDDIKWIDKATSDLLPRSKLYYGDILMTYAGTIGDVAMVDADDKYHLAPNVAKITLKEEAYNPIFLMHLFLYTNNYIMTFASKVAQASINMGKIRNLEYFFPDIDMQNWFATFVEQVDKSKSVVQKALDEAQLLFDSLMQQYFG
ncbi:MAG: restriction endonuclease subunit S [Butyricicoccaceae bacterium]|uniref:restriction endonuclease subunit S n=1 Tax=Agathobaculum butyriciproducens TaxID=1628085 RepID=UPI001D05E76A|nr:restriction endonuclease subunit S [Agathobaculum butyriciproducens]MCQ5048004.1 restriction endonuclease subunit S [Agathobaculum butyriciproducens]